MRLRRDEGEGEWGGGNAPGRPIRARVRREGKEARLGVKARLEPRMWTFSAPSHEASMTLNEINLKRPNPIVVAVVEQQGVRTSPSTSHYTQSVSVGAWGGGCRDGAYVLRDGFVLNWASEQLV